MSWNSKDDGWGSSSNNNQSTNNQKKRSSDNDGWGSSNDDGWGSSSNNNQDTSNQRKRSNNNDGWGSNNDSGWGSSNNNNQNTNNQRNKSNDNGGWGSSSNNNQNTNNQRNRSNNDGGWGSSSNNNQNTNNQQNKSNNDGGWGSNNDDGWGSSADNHQDKNHQRKESNNDGGWGSGNNDDQDTDDQRKRFKKDPNAEERPAPYKPDEIDLDEEAKLQGDGAGENFNRYQDQTVTCLPADCIKPIEKFTDFLTSELLLKNIETQKYGGMTPIQKWSIPAILNNHDLIGCAQTGSGKTAAFLLPILQKILDLKPESGRDEDCQNPYCLIISPTRELAHQINIHANMLSKDSIIKCHVIYGQVSTGHLKSKLSTGCHILVATPGRLKDFVNRGWIEFKNIKYIILDEGDRLVDEGFTSDIAGFFDHETMPSKEDRQTLFFSATFREETQMNARKYLKDDFLFLTVGRVGAANEDIKQEFIQVNRQEKKRELKKILADVPENDKTIVFTQTKNAADMLAGFFTALNLSSTSIHGDRLQSQREQAIRAFRKGEKRFLISSPVGNRGLDLPKVALVINYDLPANIDEYVHRIGRTGRAGHTGRAISFYDQERDTELLPHLVEILTEAKQEIPDWMKGGDNPAPLNSNDDWNNQSDAVEAPADAPADAPAVVASADDGWGGSSW